MNSELRDAQLHTGRDITSSVSQGAGISSNLSLSSYVLWDPPTSLLFLAIFLAPSHPQGKIWYYLSGRLGQELRHDRCWKRSPDLCRMSLPHPNSPCKKINLCTTPIHRIVDARLFIVSFVPLHLKVTQFSISPGIYILTPSCISSP